MKKRLGVLVGLSCLLAVGYCVYLLAERKVVLNEFMYIFYLDGIPILTAIGTSLVLAHFLRRH